MRQRRNSATTVRTAGQQSLAFLVDEGWAGPVETTDGLEYTGSGLTLRLDVVDGPTLTIGSPDGPRAALGAVWNACGLPAPVPRPRVDELTKALRTILPYVLGPDRDAILNDAARGLRRLSPRAATGAVRSTAERLAGPDATRSHGSPSD